MMYLYIYLLVCLSTSKGLSFVVENHVKMSGSQVFLGLQLLMTVHGNIGNGEWIAGYLLSLEA